MTRSSNRRRRSRGAVLVEYAFLLTAFAIPTMMGIVLGGIRMFEEYQTVRKEILKPLP